MNSHYILSLFTLVILSSCSTSPNKVSDVSDYNDYLNVAENKTMMDAQKDYDFWTAKSAEAHNPYSYASQIANSQSALFATTGNIDYLKSAETHLVQLNQSNNYSVSGPMRSLAANYISQHKFKEALQLLNKAEMNGDNLDGTKKMLFDVHLELGNYKLAKTYLEGFANMSDFDYLIRLSKWSDHQGNLDAAIQYMEKAKVIAEASNLDGIKQWSYTNLADFYGHAGRIEDSYTHFLKALELDPNDAYAKKGIAWIVYSHEKNPDEALRILNTVMKDYHAPDYYLLKSEIFEFKGDLTSKNEQLALYHDAVKNEAYGVMYNQYNVQLYTQENHNLLEAIAIAKIEVENRPTPHSYDLLAWSYFKNGQLQEALQLTKNHVLGHTSEPKALYHSAEILKASGNLEKVKELKPDLMASSYELGPIMAEKVSKL
ncbi:tetratricopeptide repeat protein [Gelidibacter sediminis]|uniref:Tetratricopeptide repeat protein n=1 Tax=Gelidibacter sediminis TaxID=1608710 RepID=A0A4R7PXF4_9FLAO|nr:cell surface protein [Gelidibacter sediminis]TDU39637.1 tetratricopeptide repeat protein [Gelidibacter sediminis]